MNRLSLKWPALANYPCQNPASPETMGMLGVFEGSKMVVGWSDMASSLNDMRKDYFLFETLLFRPYSDLVLKFSSHINRFPCVAVTLHKQYSTYFHYSRAVSISSGHHVSFRFHVK